MRDDHADATRRSPKVTWSTLFQLIGYMIVLMAIAVIPIAFWLAGAIVVTNQKRNTVPPPAPPVPASG